MKRPALCRTCLLVVLGSVPGVLPALEPIAVPTALGDASVTPSLRTLLGLQRGNGINYGLGAFDSPGETERSTLYLAVKPRLDLSLALGPAAAVGPSSLYGGVSVVAATTTLDGEISGQIARAGDSAFDTDHAYVGWRNDLVDLSVGGQEFTVGDGFIVGDGNFNQGGEDGQYWTGAFSAWRNSAVVKVNTQPVRADLFWLRTDEDLGDSRVAGISLETSTAKEYGTLGFLYLEVMQGQAFNLGGIEAWNLRASAIRVPGVPDLLLYGEWVLERGDDDAAGGRANDAVGWYVEGEYSFPMLPWTPRLNYRYVRLSGDELDTPENEEYRGLFFTIFKRDWDTWYQGEIAGEYHLFNQNQVTQMVKLKLFPRPTWALALYYYRHELEEPQYFGRRVSDTAWADELNVGVERFLGKYFYGYVGFAWSTPDTAARELLGDEDFGVVQTFLSYTF